jgi:hypothetical protein
MKADQRSLRMVAGPSAPGCTQQDKAIAWGKDGVRLVWQWEGRRVVLAGSRREVRMEICNV